MAIETLLDLDDLTVDELVKRLKAAEELYDLGGATGSSTARLNLTKDKLVERMLSQLQVFGEAVTETGAPQLSTKDAVTAAAHPKAGARGHRRLKILCQRQRQEKEETHRQRVCPLWQDRPLGTRVPQEAGRTGACGRGGG